MADRSAVTVTASSAKTVTGNSGPLQVPPASASLAIEAFVTAVTGTTPSMTLSMVRGWRVTFADADPADAFTAITAASNKAKSFSIKGQFFQLVWTITGTTPSFTFSAVAYGV